MARFRQMTVLGATSILLVALLRKPIVFSLRSAHDGWRQDPGKMVIKLALSLLSGQAVFWRYGFDQLGLFMNPKVQMGAGQEVAERAYVRIPHSPAAAWTVKLIEILTDAGKIPLEGAVYRRYGIAPDLVAAAVTQPLWSTLETAEKISGAVLYPERVSDPEQVKLSLGCIYGSLFRYLLAGLIWVIGETITRPAKKPVVE